MAPTEGRVARPERRWGDFVPNKATVQANRLPERCFQHPPGRQDGKLFSRYPFRPYALVEPFSKTETPEETSM